MAQFLKKSEEFVFVAYIWYKALEEMCREKTATFFDVRLWTFSRRFLKKKPFKDVQKREK